MAISRLWTADHKPYPSRTRDGFYFCGAIIEAVTTKSLKKRSGLATFFVICMLVVKILHLLV